MTGRGGRKREISLDRVPSSSANTVNYSPAGGLVAEARRVPLNER